MSAPLAFGLSMAAVSAVFILAIWGLYWAIVTSPRARPPKPDDGMRQCRGCGDTYHQSWGSLCPNCSGAD